jgi:glutathione S-transferase
MADIILHHYQLSPFARKVRAVFGYKSLSWKSCIQSRVLPRPELSIMTGAFRRIPVMQVGADLFCDSNLALRVLERLQPAPPIRPASDLLSQPLSQWFEPRMFSVFSALRFRHPDDVKGVFASQEERNEFVRDRAPFMAPMMDISKNAENAPTTAAHARIFVQWIEDRLAETGAFLQGVRPTHADFSAWHPLNWIKDQSARRDLLPEFDRVWAWVDRLAAFGEGPHSPVSPADAVSVARQASAAFSLPHAPGPGDPAQGSRVRIGSTDYGTDAVEGDVLSIGLDHVSIRRETPETGDIALHFPRWGYCVVPA